ncbi:cytochrome c oxidase assembly protein COX16 homolog, mitochondrial isoform X1 [Anas acuta]|uniref:cytochrome c oxidase assembly protein COX16 homolog, mitochondrial isoform X1 n=1 Tax=Anas acuta TaxID=28680 RepID=UPI0035C8A51B
MERLRRLWRGRTMTYGVPLLLYLVGGSFGLREFAQIRYDVHKLHGTIQMKRRLLTGETHSAAIVDPALKEKLKQNNVTLESEYEPQNWRFQVVFVASSVLLHWKRSHIPFNQAQLYIYEKEPAHVRDVHPWLLLY